MNAIAAPIRVRSFSELKSGEQIWSIGRNGTVEIIEFVKTFDKPLEKYAIFLNMSKDGMPKFYENRLKDEKWYKYEGNATTWYHIYSAQVRFHEDEANDYKELAVKNIVSKGTLIDAEYEQIDESDIEVGDYICIDGEFSFCSFGRHLIDKIRTRYDEDTGKKYVVYIDTDGNIWNSKTRCCMNGLYAYSIVGFCRRKN